MSTELTTNEMRKSLTETFGKLCIKPIDHQFSATVEGFAAYGGNNFLLSIAGETEDAAIKNLFEQIVQSAVRKDAERQLHPLSTSHVYNSERKEIVYDEQNRFTVTDNVYSDQLGF